MLIDVQTFFFYASVNAQAVYLLDAEEQDESAYSSPKVYHQHAESLCSEETPSATVESACLCCQQTSHQGAENTAYAVYRAGTHGVVDVKLVVYKLDGEYQYQSANESDDYSAQRRYQVTSCRNAYKTCQHAVQRQRE